MQQQGKNLPPGSTGRTLVVRNNKRFGFSWDLDELADDGLDSKDFRPDAAVVLKSTTQEQLDGERGFSFVHVPVEFKTAAGSNELGQVGGYWTAFRPPGCRYQVGLSIRQTTCTLFLLAPTGWAKVSTCDYLDRSKAVAEMLAFLLSDAPRDDSLLKLMGRGIDLMSLDEAEAVYEGRCAPAESPSLTFVPSTVDKRLPRPFFSSELLFGSRTQAWALHGELQDKEGDVQEEGQFIVTVKIVRKGKAVNGFVFSSRLARQAAQHAQLGWFEESLGVHVDRSTWDRHESHRVRVVEVFRGSRMATWDEAMHGQLLTVGKCIEALRACLVVLWRMRPMHHRDVSVYNLLVDCSMAVVTDPIGLDDEPQRLPARPFDFGNSRWANEASDGNKRRTRTVSLSGDDCWTGTYCFLSRAALYLDEFADDDGEDESAAAQHVKSVARHRHWHDAESLFLCFCAMVGSRFLRDGRLKEGLEAWLSSPADLPRSSWLDQASFLVRRLLRVKPLTTREAVEIKVTSTLLFACVDVLKRVVDVDRVAGEELAEGLFGGGPERDQQVFEGLLAACNEALAGLSVDVVGAQEDVCRLEGGPATRVLRSQTLNERVGASRSDPAESSKRSVEQDASTLQRSPKKQRRAGSSSGGKKDDAH